MRLSDQQKEAVRRLLALTETKQFALSSHSGLSPSVVSEMTNPGRDRDIQIDTWRKFTAGLEKVVADYKAKNPDGASMADVERLLGDVTQDAVDVVQDPGGWIASSARNYIERRVDRALARYLDQNAGAMVTVQGPVQSGRSSAVRRLADHAAARGFSANFVDFEVFAGLHPDGGWTADKAAKWVLTQLDIEPPTAAFSKGEFGVEVVNALLRGLESRTNRVRRAFLIFDSFDVLARTVADAVEQDLLGRWLTGVRNTIPNTPPFDRMTLVIVANTPQWPMDGVMSTTLSHGRSILTGAFNEEEVRDLFAAHDLAGDDCRAARNYALNDLFGHPYLTHGVASELAFGESLANVKRAAASLEGNFDRHWRVIWRLVCQFYRDHTQPEAPAARLLQRAVKLADGTGGGEVSVAELRFLKSLGVLTGGEEPQMCAFYRRAIERKTKQYSEPQES